MCHPRVRDEHGRGGGIRTVPAREGEDEGRRAWKRAERAGRRFPDPVSAGLSFNKGGRAGRGGQGPRSSPNTPAAPAAASARPAFARSATTSPGWRGRAWRAGPRRPTPVPLGPRDPPTAARSKALRTERPRPLVRPLRPPTTPKQRRSAGPRTKASTVPSPHAGEGDPVICLGPSPFSDAAAGSQTQRKRRANVW